MPMQAHFPAGAAAAAVHSRPIKKLSPVSMRGNSQNGGQTTKSLLIKPQCSGVPIQQAVSLSSSFPRHCLLFVCTFRRKPQKTLWCVRGWNSRFLLSEKECPGNVCKRFRGTFYGTGYSSQPSSRLTMASIRSKHSSIWRTSVNWVRARSRLWPGRAVWK